MKPPKKKQASKGVTKFPGSRTLAHRTKRTPGERENSAERVRKTNDELMALVTELQRRDSEMQSLISMHDLLQSCTTQEEAYKVVALAAAELFDGQTGCLAVLHAWDQYLEVVARWGDGPLGEPIFSMEDCWALRRGQLHEVANPQAVCCAVILPVNGRLAICVCR